MKKFLLTISAVLAFAGTALSAPDVISMRNTGQTIDNVSVLSVTQEEVVYKLNDTTLTLPRNLVEGILYDDGRYESLSITMVGSEETKQAAEQLGYDAQQLQELMEAGQSRTMLLWQDKSYPNDCRKAGKKAYFKTFGSLYKSALQQAKAEGKRGLQAVQYATNVAFPAAVKAGNEAVRECNGGM